MERVRISTAQRSSSGIVRTEPQFPLLGMLRERQRLCAAFAASDPLLLLGPSGSGKTRIFQEAILSSLRDVLYIAPESTLHGLLKAMARALIAARHAGFLRHAKPGPDSEAWLAEQTSVHLRGLLWTAVEISPVPMILDGVVGAGFPTYRFLQRIYHTPGMTLFAASRDAFSLGALARLFWNPAKTLTIPPLHDRDAEELFDIAADYFKLRHLDLDEFREKVLESGHGNPGQIIEMCRLAMEPQDHAGRYIKFAPLRIDTVMRFAR